MIALELTPDCPASRLYATLERGDIVRTPVDQYPDREVSAAGPVRLGQGDHECSRCDDLIDPEAYGEGAPMVMILARQKQRYGATYCTDHLSEVQR